MSDDGANSDDEREVEAAIRAAFAGVERPAALADRPSSDVDDLAREVQVRAWSELSMPQLMRHRLALGLLSGAAFRFFLPAYLVAALGGEVDLRDAALHALAPSSRPQGPTPADEAAFRQRTGALDEAQRDAIRRWVRWARTKIVGRKAFPALDPAGVWA
jgi:hypothetical protein